MKPRKRVKRFARFCRCHYEIAPGGATGNFIGEFLTPEALGLGGGLNDEEDWDKYDAEKQ